MYIERDFNELIIHQCPFDYKITSKLLIEFRFDEDRDDVEFNCRVDKCSYNAHVIINLVNTDTHDELNELAAIAATSMVTELISCHDSDKLCEETLNECDFGLGSHTQNKVNAASLMAGMIASHIKDFYYEFMNEIMSDDDPDVDPSDEPDESDEDSKCNKHDHEKKSDSEPKPEPGVKFQVLSDNSSGNTRQVGLVVDYPKAQGRSLAALSIDTIAINVKRVTDEQLSSIYRRIGSYSKEVAALILSNRDEVEEVLANTGIKFKPKELIFDGNDILVVDFTTSTIRKIDRFYDSVVYLRPLI